MVDKEYLDKFESNMQEGLHGYLLRLGEVDEMMPDAPDIEEKWQEIGSAYMEDGVREYAGYPTVSLGWMLYVGMAVAKMWDENWEKYAAVDNLYLLVRTPRGYDCMDEYVREEVLGLKGEEYKALEKLVGDVATIALRGIQREQFEPGCAMAFHAYVRVLHVLYTIGAAVQLHRMGYKMEKMEGI